MRTYRSQALRNTPLSLIWDDYFNHSVSFLRSMLMRPERIMKMFHKFRI